jgi:hypothetical protein
MRRGALRGLLFAAGVAAATSAAADPLVHQEWEPATGLLRIGPEPERAVPLTESGHTLILPETGRPRGLIVFFLRGRVEASGAPAPGSLDDEALSRGVGLLHVATGDPLDFFFRDAVMREVAARIDAVLAEQELTGIPLLFAGLSLGGTRALKLAVFLEEHPGEFRCSPTAAAVVDAPLDMSRFWRAEQRAARDAFHPAAADEGRWVSYLLEQNLGGTPDERPGAYAAYSPFTHDADRGGNARFLTRLPVRAYHEPDVDWWIRNRRKSYYQMNSIDLAAMVNALMLAGNDRAELVSTHGAREGYAGGSSPHSWSIVDDGDLVEWFLEQIGPDRKPGGAR